MGERIRTFEPELGSVLKNPGVFSFDIDDDGNIFIADIDGDNVIWLNSNLTDYRKIMQRNREIESPCNLVYIAEKPTTVGAGKNRSWSSWAPVFLICVPPESVQSPLTTDIKKIWREIFDS